MRAPVKKRFRTRLPPCGNLTEMQRLEERDVEPHAWSRSPLRGAAQAADVRRHQGPCEESPEEQARELDWMSRQEEDEMGNGSDESAGRSPVTGEPVDVDEARREEAKEKIREKVQERVEDLAEIIRKKHGLPGTP